MPLAVKPYVLCLRRNQKKNPSPERLAPAPAESHGLAVPELKLCANACLVLRPPERQPGRARDCLVRGCKSEERSTIRCLNTFRNNIAPYVDLLELRYTGKIGLGIFSRPGCFIPKYTFISEYLDQIPLEDALESQSDYVFDLTGGVPEIRLGISIPDRDDERRGSSKKVRQSFLKPCCNQVGN
jgi:hypothetical protein